MQQGLLEYSLCQGNLPQREHKLNSPVCHYYCCYIVTPHSAKEPLAVQMPAYVTQTCQRYPLPQRAAVIS